MNPRRIANLTLVLALAILSSACSGESSPSREAASESETTTSDATSARPDDQLPAGPATTLDPEDVVALDPQQCARFKELIELGPSQPLIPGSITDEVKQQVLVELASTVESAPDETKEAMSIFADAYEKVIDELANLNGDLADPDSIDPAQLERIDEIMTAPEVLSATAQISAWTNQC